MAAKFSIREFQHSLAALASSLRHTIKAECLGFDTGAEAMAARRSQVADPVNGYRYFVQTYFPHYIRHADPSELHGCLFQRLPQVVASSKGEQDAIATARRTESPSQRCSDSCLCCGVWYAASSTMP